MCQDGIGAMADLEPAFAREPTAQLPSVPPRSGIPPRLQTRRQSWRSPSWERTQGLATASPYRSPTESSAPASACVFVHQRASATSFPKNSIALIERLAGTPGPASTVRKPPSGNVNGCTHRFLPNPLRSPGVDRPDGSDTPPLVPHPVRRGGRSGRNPSRSSKETREACRAGNPEVHRV